MNKTHKLPPFSMRAAFTPASVNEETRTVDLVWTTAGVKVKRSSWADGEFYEELSLDPKHVRMDRLSSGRSPLLADHDSRSIDSVLGVIESARVAGGQGTATVRFAKDDPAADAVWNKVRQGILPNVSVGYRIHKFEKVAGGDDTVPTFRAVDWEPHEISLVTVGADPTAKVRSEEEHNLCEFPFTHRAAAHKESSTMETEQEKAARLAREEETRKAELKAATDAAVKADRERMSGIRSAVRAAKLGEALAEEMISAGTDLSDARARVLEELAKRDDESPNQTHSGIEVGTTDNEKFQRHAAAALFVRGGVMDTIEAAKAKGARGFRELETDPGEFRGHTMADLARVSLERRGIRTGHMNRDQVVARAFTERGGGMSGTSDFAVLLENVMYKTLLGAYTTAPDSWKAFCKVDTVQDFRPSNRYRTGSFGVLDNLNEAGEYKNKAIPDGTKQSITVGSKGNIIALTRQAVINDDMGALTDVTSRFGRAAGLSIEVDVYALIQANSGLGFLPDGTTPFFSAGNGNLNATGSALSVSGLDSDRVVMAQQKDISNNEYLDLRPKTLLIPIGLGGQARVVNNSQYDTEVSSKFQVPNKVAGLFQQIIDTPRLSGTRRYIFADPAVAPAIVVAFLNGEQAPRMESQMGWRTDGQEWKLGLDVKAQWFDPKGALTNAGV